MNFYVIYKTKDSVEVDTVFLTYRDESDIVFSSESLVRDIDDVERILSRYFGTREFVAVETLLDYKSFISSMNDSERFKLNNLL